MYRVVVETHSCDSGRSVRDGYDRRGDRCNEEMEQGKFIPEGPDQGSNRLSARTKEGIRYPVQGSKWRWLELPEFHGLGSVLRMITTLQGRYWVVHTDYRVA